MRRIRCGGGREAAAKAAFLDEVEEVLFDAFGGFASGSVSASAAVGGETAKQYVQKTAKVTDAESYARRLQEVMPEFAAEEINRVNDFGETPFLISQRNNAVGRPSAIVQFDVELNSRQKQLIEKLPEYNASVVVGKDNVNMADLAALTAKTGCEYAMFTRGSQRLIIRGNGTSVDVNIDKAIELMQNGYKWSGHTHPGNDRNCLIASGADYEILKAFNQKQSVTYNSNGQYLVYEVGE